MLLRVEEVRYLGSRSFNVRFNDGRSGMADIRPMAEEGPGTVFAPLADEDFVRRFTLEHGTLCWPGELDVASEYIYFLAFRDDPALHARFVGWGYLPQTARA